jgi:hypothetical protein
MPVEQENDQPLFPFLISPIYGARGGSGAAAHLAPGRGPKRRGKIGGNPIRRHKCLGLGKGTRGNVCYWVSPVLEIGHSPFLTPLFSIVCPSHPSGMRAISPGCAATRGSGTIVRYSHPSGMPAIGRVNADHPESPSEDNGFDPSGIGLRYGESFPEVASPRLRNHRLIARTLPG